MIDAVSSAPGFSLRELPFGRPAGIPAPPVPRGWRAARPLFCPCGKTQPEVAGLCRSCYERSRYSRRHFGGLRFEALVRDQFRCRVCASPRYPVVHRREPEQHQLETFVTLCASCLGVVMYLDRPASWLPPLLLALWREQHPGAVLQQQFEFGGWQAPPPKGPSAAQLPPPGPVAEPSQGVLFR